jgi:pimeloyl-ACP methyl ester carboxylesterase
MRMTTSVIVPGLGLTGESWAPTLHAMARRVLAAGDFGTMLLPGYGLPAGEQDDLHPAMLARRLLDELDGRQAHLLIGHSASCQVVAHAAASAPDRVAGLVLVGPTTDPRATSWPRLASRWLATARHEDPRQVPSLVRQYRQTGTGTMLRAMDAARSDRIDDVLRRVGCPVLILRGWHDRIAPSDWLATLTGRAGGSSTGAGRRAAVTVPAGGHMIPTTHGELVALEVARFSAALRPLASGGSHCGDDQ